MNVEFLAEYGLFLAKTLTFLVAVLVAAAFLFGMSQRGRQTSSGHIEVHSLNDNFENITRTLKQMVMDPESLKLENKAEKKRHKEESKQQKKDAKIAAAASTADATSTAAPAPRKQRVYVIDFDGDVQASAVDQLREEVTAILSVAEQVDEVVVRLESPGGVVHSYGLAASQLRRIVDKQVPLTVAVDKVAASGGYMMACIANKLIAAPFAILGSIGVVAQIPNIHRLLKNKDIDVEILTAGEYKRTMTMFGENTDKGRQKFIEELEEVHTLFKDFVGENRPVVDTDKVATGEAWYGKRALEQKLVDALQTSDEYISEKCEQADVYRVKYVKDINRVDKIMDRFTGLLKKMKMKEDISHPGPYTFWDWPVAAVSLKTIVDDSWRWLRFRTTVLPSVEKITHLKILFKHV